MRKFIVLFMIVALPVAGTLVGTLAGPFLARGNYTVRVAASVKAESEDKAAERTLEGDAFRAKDGDVSALYGRARRVQSDFRTGGAIFGAWCGFVLAIRFFIVHREERRTVYDISQFRCVACTRCYLSCPREHHRLRNLKDDSHHGEPARVD